MKRKIWIQIDSFRPCGNAPANRAYSFCTFLSSKGFDTNVVTISETTSESSEFGCKVFRLKNKYHYKPKSLLNRLLDNYCHYKNLKKFYKKHKLSLKDSVVILSVPEYIPSLIVKKLKKYGAIVIADVRDIWPEVAIEMKSMKENSIMAKIFRKIAGNLYQKADFISTVSRLKVEYFKSAFDKKYANKVLYIGNGFDLEVLKNVNDESLFKKISLENKEIISYVGNVGKAQHLNHFLELAKKFKQYNFVIGGVGADLEELKKYANNNGLNNVIFLGELNKNEAVAVTMASKISFVPLADDSMINSVPTKLFESLGLGVPVLLVANGESCEILDKTMLGVHILPSQSNNLEQEFIKMNNNYNEIISHKSRCMDIIKNEYSRQYFCSELVKVIEKL